MQATRYRGRRRRPVIEDEDSVSAAFLIAVLVLGIIVAVALWTALGEYSPPAPTLPAASHA